MYEHWNDTGKTSMALAQDDRQIHEAFRILKEKKKGPFDLAQ